MTGSASEPMLLTADDLAFFRLTCDLFPAPESPLRFVDDEGLEPADTEASFASLEERGLLSANGAGASREVLDRLTAVSECRARVSLAVHGPRNVVRDFYIGEDGGVEYRRQDEQFSLGPLRSETAITAELAQHFKPAGDASPLSLRMSASDYLVFAVFARDLRAAPEPVPEGEAPMSLDEVLAFFDEPETKILRTPSDDTWQASVETLCQAGVLVQGTDGFGMHAVLHAVAREIVADHEHIVTRFDFLDEHWLVREVSLYPTTEAVYRLGSAADGSVAIDELSTASLADILASVIGTLPNLLNPEVPPTFKAPMMANRP